MFQPWACSKRRGDVLREGHAPLDRQHAPSPKQFFQRLSLNILERDPGKAVLFPGVKHGDDRWMVEFGRGLCFGREPCEIIFPRGPVKIGINRNDFQGDFPVQYRIMGKVYLAHRTFAQLADDHVPAERKLRSVNFFFPKSFHNLIQPARFDTPTQRATQRAKIQLDTLNCIIILSFITE